MERNQNKDEYTGLRVVVLVVILAIFGAFAYYRTGVFDEPKENPSLAQSQPAVLSAQPATLSASTIYPRFKQDSLPPPELSARSYLVYDARSQRVLVSYKADQVFPVASLTKLTTALLVSRYLSPDQVITVTTEAIIDSPKPVLGLIPGENITAGSLVEGMLVASANDAASVLAYAVGEGNYQEAVGLMNTLAEALGLKRTHYANSTGLDDPQNYSTAADVLSVVFEIYRTPWLLDLMAETRGEVRSVDGQIIHAFRTTNSLLTSQAEIVKAGKTGFTDEALGNLVVLAKSPGGSDVIAILIGSQEREEEMLELINWTFVSHDW